MADLKGQVRAQTQAKSITLLKKYVTVEVLVANDADTITIDSIVNIDNAKVISLLDASDITVNTSGNVITINDIAVVNSHLLCTVVGT